MRNRGANGVSAGKAKTREIRGQAASQYTRIGHALPLAKGVGTALAALALVVPLAAQQHAAPATPRASAGQSFPEQTAQDYNARIQQLLQTGGVSSFNSPLGNYQIGPEDLLQISVMEAPDLGRTVRVAEDGEISLPLLGAVRAAGLTSRQLETVLEYLLSRKYMKDPHVSVFVAEMRSHPVSVFGAVEKPGVFEIRGPKTLVEVLSLAQGLAPDAGDTVIVMHHAGDPGFGASAASPSSVSEARPGKTEGLNVSPQPEPVPTKSGAPLLLSSTAEPTAVTYGPKDGSAAGELDGSASVRIRLKDLLNSGDPRYNALVYPGDVVKVTRAGIVYVVGQVNKPGGFLLQTNENLSVLQALALAEGLSPTAAGKKARIIEPGAIPGSRKQVAVNLEKILNGKSPDITLRSQDILFVPSSRGKSILHGFTQSMGGIVMAASSAAIYRY